MLEDPTVLKILYFVALIQVMAVNGSIGFAIGHSQKRQGRLGGLLGTALGPIGWLLVLGVHSRWMVCGKCQKNIHPDANHCPYCCSMLRSPT